MAELSARKRGSVTGDGSRTGADNGAGRPTGDGSARFGEGHPRGRETRAASTAALQRGSAKDEGAAQQRLLMARRTSEREMMPISLSFSTTG
jgi:hypothetical protein